MAHQGVYLNQDSEKIRETLRWLREQKRAIKHAVASPFSPDTTEQVRDQYRRRFYFYLETAINRKAGISDCPGRKASREYQTMLYRDQRRVRDRVLNRVRVYQFETKEARKRFSHLLSSREED